VLTDETPDPQACHGFCRCPRCGQEAFWSLLHSVHMCMNPACGHQFAEHDPKIFDGVRFHQPES
jgi:uncharacterized protein (DUF983 family)